MNLVNVMAEAQVFDKDTNPHFAENLWKLTKSYADEIMSQDSDRMERWKALIVAVRGQPNLNPSDNPENVDNTTQSGETNTTEEKNVKETIENQKADLAAEVVDEMADEFDATSPSLTMVKARDSVEDIVEKESVV